MADFSVKIKAEELGKSLENLAEGVEAELNQAVADLATAAYANIIATAQAKLNSTRADYIRNLSFDRIGDNAFLISLDGDWATKLEEGFPGYDMKPGMLSSSKTVSVGSRAGEPWVKRSKDGNRYAAVPFERKPFTKEAGRAGDLASAIREMTVQNQKGRKQKLTSIFKDASGNPLTGKVATARSDVKDLDQIVKYQKIYQNPNTGKKTVQSIYMTYRTVSDKSTGWNHPGYEGLKAFLEAEQFIEKSIEDIINTLL